MSTQTSYDQSAIVVGVDASAHAARAAAWAADEAARRRAPLRLIHALEADPSSALIGPGAYGAHVHAADQAGEQLLTEIRQRLLDNHPTVAITTELAHQTAPGALVQASRTADLLVVGTRGRGGFAGLPLGSVAARLAAHSHCPVVILRDHDYSHDHDHSHEHRHEHAPAAVSDAGIVSDAEIVLGMQAHTAQQAILFAFTQAERLHVGVRAVHAWAPYPAHAQGYLSDTDIIARTAAEHMVADLAPVREKFPDVHVTLSVQRGHPSAVLADASEHAQLTVVGAHRHNHPLSIGLGPVIHALLGHAHSPVAVIPIP